MSYSDIKITQADINENNVRSASDILIGDADDNKAVFDKLPEFIAGKHNELVDALDEVSQGDSEAIEELSAEKLNSPMNGLDPAPGNQGDVLTSEGNGRTQWTDRNELVSPWLDVHGEELIGSWLDEHPEATTTVQDGSLTEVKFTDALKLKAIKDYVTPEMYGAKGDGVTDDTDAIQSAIDSDSGLVLFGHGKTYLSSCLIPKSNKIIDLNNSTLFLKNNTELPIFYVIAEDTGHSFKVCNGQIDCNMDNNHAVNQSAGTFWITNWEGLEFSDLKITHAFRNAINLWNCKNIKVENVDCVDCGMSNSGGFYSYGAAFEPTCENVIVNNFNIENMYGYGIHFNETLDYKCTNCNFDTLTGIAITCTKSQNGVIENIICKSVSGDNLEINANKNVAIKNVSIKNAGIRALLFGDNSTGINNERIIVDNFICADTVGTYSASFNYLVDSIIRNCTFDKQIATQNTLPLHDTIFENCKINMNCASMFFLPRFTLKNCIFNDFTVDSNNWFIDLRNNAYIGINNGETSELNLINASDYALGGTIKVLSRFSDNNNQNTIKEVPISIANWSVGDNIYKIDGTAVRNIAISMDSVNKKLIFTNSTGVRLIVDCELKLYKSPTRIY